MRCSPYKLVNRIPAINMDPKNRGLVQMVFLFNWVLFRFHVNFQGCIYRGMNNEALLLAEVFVEFCGKISSKF